jgi:hypothetical protein
LSRSNATTPKNELENEDESVASATSSQADPAVKDIIKTTPDTKKTSTSNGEESTPPPKSIESTKSGGHTIPRPSPKTPSAVGKQPLVALDEKGLPFAVHVIVNGQRFLPIEARAVSSRKRTRSAGDVGPTNAKPRTPLGHDGNLFHCHICHGFGDVVCCDGCPHVYHRKCIPTEDPSRISLDNDEDPWFCPSCWPKNDGVVPIIGTKSDAKAARLAAEETKSTTSNSSTTSSDNINKSPVPKQQRTCCECDQVSMHLKQCEGCKAWLHYPSCKQERKKEDRAILCASCRLEIQQDTSMEQEEDEEMEDVLGSPKAENGTPIKRDEALTEEDAAMTRPRTRSASMGDDEEALEQSSVGDGSQQSKSTQDDEEDDEEEDLPLTEEAPRPAKKRRSPGLPGSSSSSLKNDLLVPSTGETKPKKSSKKKKKKKKKQPQPQSPLANEKDASGDESVPTYNYTGSGMAKATPAFYFFLAENRPKIERNLSRKHRYFNRLPKGYERNELVAKEGAIWWVKLRPSESRRFMNMSMRDFEQRIIEWKEEKNIRDMLMETDIDAEDGEVVDLSPDDELLTYQNHERLYLGTTVGSKPFKPETGVSHNRILLELLQDMRFHPVPMFVANRTETEYGQMDFARITIPYFDVHGPVSTSVGDECLGCTRGWTHVCNVLKRRVPAVEHRAKLQPPLSSLVATRIGLGLRPRPMGKPKEEENVEDGKNVALFATREQADVVASKNLPIVPWDSLTDPSSRADDIVQFIEETVAMKVAEPPRPGFPGKSQSDTSKKTMLARATLPIRGRKRSIDGLDSKEDNNGMVNKCGRCRTVIQTDTGCIQCRRAQLIIHMSKRAGREGPAAPDSSGSSGKSSKVEAKGPKSLKIQTYMLGRVTMKEGSGEVQPAGDQAIANGILRQRWTPFAILPPDTLEYISNSQDKTRTSSER